MKINVSIMINEDTGYIGIELPNYKLMQLTPAMAATILDCKVSDLKEMVHPHRKYYADGSYSFGFGFGDETGMFYRGLLKHEFRLGYSHEGIEIALTTWGGFPIYPMCKNGEKLLFNSAVDAKMFLVENIERWEKYEIPEESEE